MQLLLESRAVVLPHTLPLLCHLQKSRDLLLDMMHKPKIRGSQMEPTWIYAEFLIQPTMKIKLIKAQNTLALPIPENTLIAVQRIHR